MMIPTEQATPIAMPRFIPGNAESSAGSVETTSGGEVCVGVESAIFVAQVCCSHVKLQVWLKKEEGQAPEEYPPSPASLAARETL